MTAAQQTTIPMEEMFLVRDLTATEMSRTHKFRNVDNPTELRNFTFASAETPMQVPVSFAKALVGMEGFVVTDSKGVLQKPRIERDLNNQEITLAPDQFIARAHELTRDALLERCQKLPGGDAFKPTASKDELMSFLVGYNVDTTKAVPGAAQQAVATTATRAAPAKPVKEIPGGLGMPDPMRKEINLSDEVV